MVQINPLGRNWGPLVNWDGLGKIYAGLIISWTVILYSGIAWLVAHRHHPYLKMRNIPLAVAATTFLHVYLVKIMLAYTTNGHFLCSAEFWIMSIYLPFGIALFQANQVQLLNISTQQRKLLDGDRVSIQEPPRARGPWSRRRGLTALKQTYVFIGIGMLLQVVVTAAIYGTNRKLQGHWGKIPFAQGQAACRKGLEWIPSAFWQMFWSCMYGPYLLYQVRNVRDAHLWRLQTILCVISGFPGSPLWLAAVFSPKFKPINKYFVPPMWLAPGIIVMQACTIFFPIYSTYRSTQLSKTTLSTLQSWEDRTQWTADSTTFGSRSTHTHTHSTTTIHQKPSFRTEKSQYQDNEMYEMTISALDNAIATNPLPLLQFAATKDFTAENILFLIQVRDWKISCTASTPPTPHSRALLFHKAVEIYAQSVNEKLAIFPINIEGGIRSRLDAIFEPAVKRLRESNGEMSDPYNEITPFAGGEGEMPLSPMTPGSPGSPLKSNWPLPSTPKSEFSHAATEDEGDDGKKVDDIPGDFDEKVFDAAEKSIKYLVVTNTWRKMISEMKESLRTSHESS
ncbi:hypothetical protein L207DRAFT_581365 [Hyaloscypha variabilis F]|uniref:RGS domain-containing protein n=1 Tax=Hyaloscypha variabilis (strain UAMH 11265 / GT02V1 / F) TaxID=1149755 RepID=A0A2J6RW24_HYAVF|nr:hypothetical protein L207DRAFT_581365 [Hyaloscypha variabilis F]